MGYSPWGHKELDKTERLTYIKIYIYIYIYIYNFSYSFPLWFVIEYLNVPCTVQYDLVVHIVYI